MVSLTRALYDLYYALTDEQQERFLDPIDVFYHSDCSPMLSSLTKELYDLDYVLTEKQSDAAAAHQTMVQIQPDDLNDFLR